MSNSKAVVNENSDMDLVIVDLLLTELECLSYTVIYGNL